MFNIVIEIKAPELAESIRLLATSLHVTGLKVAEAHQAQNTTAEMANPVNQVNQYFPPAQMPGQTPVQIATPQGAAPATIPATQPPYFPQPPIPVSAPVPAPMPVAPAPATTVPTTPQTYTLEQLAVAATQLVDAGRRTELVGLLGSFGVQALTALPKEQYGNFATQLRAMGAKI